MRGRMAGVFVLPLLALWLAWGGCSGESPEAGFAAFAAHGRAGDYDAMWDRLYEPTRWQAEITLGSLAASYFIEDAFLTVSDIARMEGPELLALFHEHGQADALALLDGRAEVFLLHQSGEEALILVRAHDDQAIVPMRREGRVWKVDGSWGR